MAQKSLKQSRSEIECEDDLQSWMRAGMEQYGWTVLREVSARNSNARADIVAKHDDIGTVGIECKYVTGGPIVAAEAARQVIEKYADEMFFQWDVDIWGVCLYGRSYRPKDMLPDRDYRQDMARSQVATTKRILNGFGLGYVTTDEDRLMMEFLPSGRDVRIPLFRADGKMSNHHKQHTDLERIKSLIDERRP